MASTTQIDKLRRYLQDYYSKVDGSILVTADQAFTDVELTDMIDDSFLEATDGHRDSSTGSGDDEALAMLLARTNGILMIAQDESRRIKWQTNNKVVDPSGVADNLVKVAKELRERFENSKKRKIEIDKAGLTNANIGGKMIFNSTVKSNDQRNFDNATVRRNRSSDHSL